MTTAPKLTLEEFLQLPETEPASELIDGEVVQKPMPTFEHGIVQRLLSFVFTLYLRLSPDAEAAPEVRCIFGPSGAERPYVPDYVFVSDARARGPQAGQPFRGAPDLAVEILSPDDRMMKVQEKVNFYLEHGVRLVWVINPEARSVTVATSPASWRTLFEDDTLDGGAILPGFSVSVREILPSPALPTP